MIHSALVAEKPKLDPSFVEALYFCHTVWS